MAKYTNITNAPESKSSFIKKFTVEDMADCSLNQSKKHSRRAVLRKKLLIPLTHDDRITSFTDQEYQILYDPSGDGNCQFSALVFALRNMGIYRSSITLREDVINYLEENDMTDDGSPLELFAGMPWCQYLEEMAKDGTYGDEITFRAMANLFNIEILVVSTLGNEGLVRITPDNSDPFGQIILGHFAEGQGFHYVVLHQLQEVNVSTDEEQSIRSETESIHSDE